MKVTDIVPSELSDIKDEILHREFTIYHIDEYTIEAAFKNCYTEVLNKFREMDKADWRTK